MGEKTTTLGFVTVGYRKLVETLRRYAWCTSRVVRDVARDRRYLDRPVDPPISPVQKHCQRRDHQQLQRAKDEKIPGESESREVEPGGGQDRSVVRWGQDSLTGLTIANTLEG